MLIDRIEKAARDLADSERRLADMRLRFAAHSGDVQPQCRKMFELFEDANRVRRQKLAMMIDHSF